MSINLLIVYFAITLLSFSKGNNISDKRLCFDPKCSEPLSLAKSMLKYSKSYDEGLSFNPGEVVTIYSKSAGSKPALWGAEVRGKRGYIPKDVVQEYRIFHADETLKYVVPTFSRDEIPAEDAVVKDLKEENTGAAEVERGEANINEPSASINSESSNVDSYDVIDGTTIFGDPFVVATPTINPLEVKTNEVGGVSIEATASFTATTDGLKSQTQSELSPITTTTMTEKPEMSPESSENPPNTKTGVLTGMADFFSETVSTTDTVEFTEKPSPETVTSVENTGADGNIAEKHEPPSGENDVAHSQESDPIVPREDEEMIDFEEEDDDEEDDEEGDDGEDDDEADEEDLAEYENSENDIQDGDEILESMTVKNTTDPSETEAQIKSPLPLENYLKSNSKEFAAAGDDNKVDSPSEIKKVSVEKDGEVSPEAPLPEVSTQVVLNSSNAVTPMVHESNSEVSSETSFQGAAHSPADELNPGILKEGSVSGFDAVVGEKVYHVDIPRNESAPLETEIPQKSTGIDDSREKEDVDMYESSNGSSALDGSGGTLNGNNTTSNGGGHTMTGNDAGDTTTNNEGGQTTSNEGGHTRTKNDGGDTTTSNEGGETTTSNEEYFESTKNDSSDNKHSPIKNARDIELNTGISGDQVLNVESLNEAISETSHSEVSTASTVVGDITSEHNEPSNLISEDYNSSQHQPHAENLEFTRIEENSENEPAISPDEITLKHQEDETDVEEPNESVIENQQHEVENDSSGFLPTLFGSLSSGYKVVTSMFFGSGDEEVRVIEGLESSPLETPEIAAGKYSDSEPTHYQHGFIEDAHNSAAGGDSMFGSSKNSQCDGSLSDSTCGNAVSSGQVQDENSEIDQESGSWIGFFNFSIGSDSSGLFDFNVPSHGAVVYSIITGVIVLFFFLGHYLIEGNRRDGELLAKINSLEKELTVSSKECLILKKKLKHFEVKSSNLEDSAEVVSSIKDELERVQNEKLAEELSGTEQKIQELEEDLKQVSQKTQSREEEFSKQYEELKELSGCQQKKFLEDVKTKTIETEMALTRCKSLETTLTEMKEMLGVKDNEISVLQECLQKLSKGDDPKKANEQLEDILNFGKLKAELVAVKTERDHLKDELQGEEDARKLLEDHVKVIREEVEKLRKCHETAEREKVEAQTRLEVLSSYFKEKETQLQKELGNKEALWVQKHTDTSAVLQHMKSLEEEVENYSMEEICSNPDDFIENSSEKVCVEFVGETTERRGSQNETLKKEILDQERGYKSQLATFEKKAHENWVAARQAERKLDESKQEASQLRNRLTMVDKTHPTSTSQNGDDSKPNLSMIDSNGELSASSPLHLGLASNSSVDLSQESHPLYLDPNSSPPHVGGRLPPMLPHFPLPPPHSPYHHPLSPPLPFMPPPPPLTSNMYQASSAVDGHRPPPLGRMSSPPPPPSPSQSPHLAPTDSRGGEFPSPYCDRGGGGRSSSPSHGGYRGMPLDERSLGEDWSMGRYCTPPPHPPDYPPYPPPPRPHWEDEHPPPSFRPLPPSSQRADSHREHKGRKKFSKIRRFWSTLECAPSESHTQTK